MQETEYKTNIIGGRHQISKTKYALSLIRKQEEAHAYLILEHLNQENQYVIEDIHLVVKEATDGKKADIIHRSLAARHVESLITKGYHAYTWSISAEKAQDLLQLVVSEKERADKDEINYILPGNPSIPGFLGASMEGSGSEDSRDASAKQCANPSSVLLLKAGHNCYSWASAMVQSLKLSTPQKWYSLIVKYPAGEIQGTKDMDDYEPTTSDKCSLM